MVAQENSALVAPARPAALTPAAFVLRGLAAGVVAGLIAFLVAFAFGEPHIDDAIALEEAASADASAAELAAEEAEADGRGMVEVSRENQKSWGLLTGTLAIGAALGGLSGLAAAGAVGRLGRLTPRSSTALVTALGFVAVALVPFGKYPATPPAVGSGDTIGFRTAGYFAMLLISVLATIAAVVIANRMRARMEAWTAVGIVGLGYLVIVGVAAAVLPAVNELGAFPADTLWYFRRSSLFTLAALWAGIGIVLVATVGRLTDRVAAETRRRELAASL